jgi:hypothetical protein
MPSIFNRSEVSLKYFITELDKFGTIEVSILILSKISPFTHSLNFL